MAVDRAVPVKRAVEGWMQVTRCEASIQAIDDVVTRLIGILHEDILQGHLDETSQLLLYDGL